MLGEVLIASAGALLAYVLVLWVLSLPLRDVSIVDPAWPVGFVIVAWLSFAIGDGCRGRRLLLAVLTSLWGLRLGPTCSRASCGSVARIPATGSCANATASASRW